MENGIDITSYDNQISTLLKVAEYYRTPTRYIIIGSVTLPEIESFYLNDISYQPLTELFYYGMSLPDIYAYLDRISKQGLIEKKDLAMLYLYTQLNQREEMLDATNQLEDIIDDQLNRLNDNPGLLDGINAFLDNPLTPTTISIEYREWITKWLESLGAIALTLDNLSIAQTGLSEISGEAIIPHSEVNITRITLQFKPTNLDGSKISTEDAIDIFNNSRVNYLIPYIQYNGGQVYYKVFTPDAIITDDSPAGIKPKLNLITTSSAEETDFIYATMWIREPDKAIIGPNRDGYTRIIFDLQRGLFQFKTTNLQKDELVERLNYSFPTLQFGEAEEVQIAAEVDFYLNHELLDYVFLQLILNDIVFSSYLYIDEKTKAYPEKERFTLHFKSLIGIGDTSSILEATLNEKKLAEGIPALDLAAGASYLSVNITKSKTREAIYQFVNIFSRLLVLYLQSESEVKDIYNLVLADTIEVTPIGRKKKGKSTKAESRAEVLKRINPDIFGEGYPRKCQGDAQPIPVEEKDIQYWQNKLVENPKTHQWEPRQVIPFPPPPNNIVYLTCPSDKTPYFSIKENDDESKNSIYPFIPCCAKSNHADPKRDTFYNVYYHGKKRKDKKKRMNIITGKILNLGGVGAIPNPLERVLLHYSPTKREIKRTGIIRDRNSFIHCVLHALNYNNYTSLSHDRKMDMAYEIRQSIPDRIYLSVLRQELYDVSETRIREMILDDSFFDPALYYRALEELFSINIYTFISGKKPKEYRGEHPGKIEVPRHKLFHVRSFREERKTVLIYKHWGEESDNLVYPQCELIIDYDKTTKATIRLFGREMTRLAHDILLETHPSITWSFDRDNLYSHRNLYSMVEMYSRTEEKATHQYIDDYGKMRGLSFPNGQPTLFFLPSQPENLPLMEEITEATEETLRHWGNPSAITTNQSNHVDGLWFPLEEIPNYPYTVYIPISATEDYKYLPLGPTPPIGSGQEGNITQRILSLKKQISLITQLIVWLYNLSGDTVPNFMANYTSIYPEIVEDSATFYDLTGLERRLPDVKTIQDALDILEEAIPTLITESKIILYSQRFSDKIKGYLDEYSKSSRDPEEKEKRYLDNYYTVEGDFKDQRETTILIGTSLFHQWLENNTDRDFIIHDKIDASIIMNKNPLLYKDREEQVYLIQNVKGGEVERAVYVSDFWANNLINLGYQTPPLDVEIPFNTSVISPSLGLELTGEVVDTNINLLRYKDSEYASILTILA